VRRRGQPERARTSKCSGTQCDPAIVMAFLEWLDTYGDPREAH